MPLIINNIRSLIFSTITIPMVILADFSRDRERHHAARILKLIIPGFLLGTVYCIFNTLSTTGSEIIFTIGSFPVYDSTTPNLNAPFYGREVTNAVYLILAVVLFIDSLRQIKRAKVLCEMIYIYNAGKLVFALTFFTGSLLHQWWIYYTFALVSVILLGKGMMVDIQVKKRKMDKIISYIREDLIQDISIDLHAHQQVSELLKLLEIPADINTFIIVKKTQPEIKVTEDENGAKDNLVIKEISNILNRILGKNQFILIPLGTDMTGICLSVPADLDSGRAETIRICEYLRMSIPLLKDFDFGIGRSYSGLENLNKSYHEAINVVEYGKSIGGGQVIHIMDLQDETIRIEYPLKERNAFLAAVRMGDCVKAHEMLKTLLEQLSVYSIKNEKLLKVRVYELLGAMIEAAITGGGDIVKLLELSEKLFSEALIIRGSSHLAEWLKPRTDEIIDIVTCSHTNRTKNIVRKAKDYINGHFAESISVKDVADAVCISESYFKSIFKKCSGYSYSEYLTNTRIDQAKKLLNTTEKSVTEIAFDVGFQTSNSFSALFKRETGCTPTQFKNHLPEKPPAEKTSKSPS